jgi:hypothetical protein
LFLTSIVTEGGMKGLPQLPSFYTKSQVLRSTYEKCFKISYNKESHKVEVLVRIYFRIGGKKRKTFPIPHAKNENKD